MPVRALVVVATLSLGFAASVQAQEPQAFDAGTRTAIQDVITHQLDALQHGDGKAAESFATPSLKTKFPDPNQFLDMVKSNYAALLHPKSTSFGETAPSPHGPLQKMTVVAADGSVWQAIYSFEMVDGQWRISACGLVKDETQQDI